MLIDTHAHLNFNAYQDDYDEVIRRSLDNNIWLVNVGSQFETSKRAVEIAEKYQKGVYATVGLHPIHLNSGEDDSLMKIKIDKEETEFNFKEKDFDYQKYKELAQSKKVKAIGETGFDFYYKPKTKKKLEQFKNKQKEVFLKQLELAKELDLPVIFHCRFAHQDLINELRIKDCELKGVIHCFSGNWEEAKKYLEMGLYLGFNGLMFKLILNEIIEKTPLDRILIETDCPYLTPPPMEGRNEPLHLKYIAEKIAKIKNLSFEKIAETTTENAKKLFKLDV